MKRIAAFAVIAQLAFGGAALAQTETPGEGASIAGSYDKLSTGNRKIADSLFDGQSIGPNGGEAWSLDKIASEHQSGRGWGEIFKQMKADGVTGARNLGELVSGRYQARTSTASGAAGPQSVTIVTGTGRVKTVGTIRSDSSGGPGRSATAGSNGKGNSAASSSTVATARGNSATVGASSSRGSSGKSP
jgi:hypothetical protein